MTTLKKMMARERGIWAWEGSANLPVGLEWESRKRASGFWLVNAKSKAGEEQGGRLAAIGADWRRVRLTPLACPLHPRHDEDSPCKKTPHE